MSKQNQILPLSPNEKRVLEFIETFMAANGFAPSYQEIRDHFGFASFNSVQRYLKQLQSKEYIHVPSGHQKRGGLRALDRSGPGRRHRHRHPGGGG